MPSARHSPPSAIDGDCASGGIFPPYAAARAAVCGFRMVIAGFAVAVFAALLGGASLAWQIYSWLASRKPAIEVTIRREIRRDTTAQITYEVVHLTAINRGECPVELTGAGLQLNPDVGIVFSSPSVPAFENTIPGTIEPLHAAHFFFDWEKLGRGLATGQPIVGLVGLATGENASSGAQVID
jgi:hypothetical protein